MGLFALSNAHPRHFFFLRHKSLHSQKSFLPKKRKKHSEAHGFLIPEKVLTATSATTAEMLLQW